MPHTPALRTEQSTPRSLNERILYQTELNIRRTLGQGPQAVEARLRELDREWDTERTLETVAASLALAGVALGATVSKKFYALPGVIAGFLLQHAIQGWCPPLPIIRAAGVRTPREIDAERFALKLARGDFQREPYSEVERLTEPPVDTDALRLRELDIGASDVLASAASAG